MVTDYNVMKLNDIKGLMDVGMDLIESSSTRKRQDPQEPNLDNVLDLIESRSTSKRMDIIAVFLWGSRVYGTHRASSDYDFVAITKAPMDGDIMWQELQWGNKVDCLCVFFFIIRFVLGG